MRKYLTEHGLQYLLIFLSLVTALFTLFLLENRPQKILIIYGLASLYLVWGILHHYYEHDLSPAVILEYLIFASATLWVLLNIF